MKECRGLEPAKSRRVQVEAGESDNFGFGRFVSRGYARFAGHHIECI
jgi:hypothetical protein